MRFYALVQDIFQNGAVSIGFNEPLVTWLRTVDVPSNEMTAPDSGCLEKIFFYGQNDFQPKVAPSLSVGDIVCMGAERDYRLYICESVGWREMKTEELSPYQRFVVNVMKLADDHMVDVLIEVQTSIGRQAIENRGGSDVAGELARFDRDIEANGR
jgi:hypothetical protein